MTATGRTSRWRVRLFKKAHGAPGDPVAPPGSLERKDPVAYATGSFVWAKQSVENIAGGLEAGGMME